MQNKLYGLDFVFIFKNILFIYFSFQCDDSIKEHKELNDELKSVRRNLRIQKDEMDVTVIELDIYRKEKKADWLVAEVTFQEFPQVLFEKQSKIMSNE
jgi:hypothetical protein